MAARIRPACGGLMQARARRKQGTGLQRGLQRRPEHGESKGQACKPACKAGPSAAKARDRPANKWGKLLAVSHYMKTGKMLPL